MALDLKTIDERIRKLQKLRNLLADEEIRDLIVDPEMQALIREATSSAGNGAGKATGVLVMHRHLPAEGSLRRRVLDIAVARGTRFDRRHIVSQMRAEGYQFDASDPDVAVNQALRKLADARLIRVSRQGSGRRPSIYEVVQQEGKGAAQ